MVESAALLLCEDPAILVEEIGHDGSEIWWPNLSPPYNQRSFNMQEMIDCFMNRGYLLTPIEAMPCNAPAIDPTKAIPIMDEEKAKLRFIMHIGGRKGMLIGTPTYSSTGHAVAWDGKMIQDPNGMEYGLDAFEIRECWIMFEY